MIGNVEALWAFIEADGGQSATYVFRDKWDDAVIVAADEQGELIYAMMPLDDTDDQPVGRLTEKNMAWPLTRLVPEPPVSPSTREGTDK